MFPENRLLELMIIGAIALIVVGPKDLPILMRKVGQFVGKMRGMANEFRASFEELARQSELEDLRKEVEAMRADHRSLTQYNPLSQISPLSADVAPPAPAAAPLPESPAPEPAPGKPPRARKPRAKKAAGEAP